MRPSTLSHHRRTGSDPLTIDYPSATRALAPPSQWSGETGSLWWFVDKAVRTGQVHAPWVASVPTGRPLRWSAAVASGALHRRGKRLARALSSSGTDATQVLVVAPNRVWGDGRDRFFGQMLEELGRRGVAATTTYPLAAPPLGPVSHVAGLEVAVERSRSDHPHVPLEKYWRTGTTRRAAADLERYVEWTRTHEGVAAVDRPEREVRRRLEGAWWQILRGSEYARMAEALLQDLRPDAVVLMDEYDVIPHAYLAAAQSLGVPVIGLQHGHFHGRSVGYCFDAPARFLTGRNPDLFAVWGPHYEEVLVRDGGWDPDSIVVTGAPQYDLLLQRSGSFDRSSFRSRHRLPSEGPVVLWATQSHALPAEEVEAHIACAGKAMDRGTDLTWVIKPHPAEHDAGRTYASLRARGARLALPSEDTVDWILASDAVVLKHSTVGLEAMALDRPLVVLDPAQTGEGDLYVESGAAEQAIDGRGLADAVERALGGDRGRASRRRMVARTLGPTDGGASCRVADLVIRCISGPDEWTARARRGAAHRRPMP